MDSNELGNKSWLLTYPMKYDDDDDDDDDETYSISQRTLCWDRPLWTLAKFRNNLAEPMVLLIVSSLALKNTAIILYVFTRKSNTFII